ncbi:TonB-dependent receptor [Aliikangiella maris]|uniref:TonB-dependent receptor n=2 Tax=Aliikangiella maris TaxID=3162458 RepID=A0ABV3MJQ5_9GAMM
MKKCMLAAAVSAVLFAGGVNAKEVKGLVADTDGVPLTNALVKVRGTDIQVRTDDEGFFILDLPVGEYTIDVKGGRDNHFHQNIQVIEGEQDLIQVSLSDEAEHKIVVRINPLEHTALNMATPTIVMAGDELTMRKAGTLGDILQFEPGISLSSFGPAVARPVIRGLSGSRVKITNNQMIVQDASTTSADHDAGIEPLLADQIEVVKGPATLLYGSGAIGGIVNVSDRKINSEPMEGFTGGVEMRLADSATGERSGVVTLDGGEDHWNWHLDGYTSETDDIKIPGQAESHILHEQELLEEGHAEEEHTEEEHAEEEGFGLLANTRSESRGGSIGSTWLGDWGHVGVAFSQVNKEYGVPGHAHHEEEHAEEETTNEEEHTAEMHEEGVMVDMQQRRYDLQAQLNEPFAGIQQWFIGTALTDYKHAEIEEDEIGTQFKNEAWELRSYLQHQTVNGWSGIVGVQLTQRDFSAIGEEAFVPESVTKNRAIFLVEEKDYGNFKWELGGRFESQEISTAGFKHSNNGFSGSIGSVYTLSKHNIIAANFSHATRFASAEEVLSFGPHITTRSFEIGNPDLDKEVSQNLDFSYRFENERLNGEINLYWNQFNDFIYAANAAITDPCLTDEAIEEAEHDELQLVCYKQRDAEFKGIELQLSYLLFNQGNHQFKIGVMADSVKAEFSNGENIPRIPALKYGVNFSYDYADFSSNLSLVEHQKQKDVAANELPTEGFSMLDLEMAYRLHFADEELLIFLKGKNLLDEEARDHTSFLKDLAPRTGKNWLLGARYTF